MTQLVNPGGDVGGLFSSPQMADPEGQAGVGAAPGYDFQKSAIGAAELICIVGSREVLFNVDVFPEHVHLHCPFCKLAGEHHGLMIRKGVKEWSFEPMAAVPPFPGWDEHRMVLAYPHGLGGRFHLEPITCPWEKCKAKFAIDHNVVRRIA
jgi:hypothetical protein